MPPDHIERNVRRKRSVSPRAREGAEARSRGETRSDSSMAKAPKVRNAFAAGGEKLGLPARHSIRGVDHQRTQSEKAIAQLEGLN